MERKPPRKLPPTDADVLSKLDQLLEQVDGRERSVDEPLSQRDGHRHRLPAAA